LVPTRLEPQKRESRLEQTRLETEKDESVGTNVVEAAVNTGLVGATPEDGIQNRNSKESENKSESEKQNLRCTFSGNSPLGFVKLGYLTDPTFTNMQHRSELQVTSGVVPCASGNIKTTVDNKGKKRLQLRKHAVVAEVHPFSTEFIKEDEVKKTSILIQAEIQTKPNSPSIP